MRTHMHEIVHIRTYTDTITRADTRRSTRFHTCIPYVNVCMYGRGEEAFGERKTDVLLRRVRICAFNFSYAEDSTLPHWHAIFLQITLRSPAVRTSRVTLRLPRARTFTYVYAVYVFLDACFKRFRAVRSYTKHSANANVPHFTSFTLHYHMRLYILIYHILITSE